MKTIGTGANRRPARRARSAVLAGLVLLSGATMAAGSAVAAEHITRPALPAALATALEQVVAPLAERQAPDLTVELNNPEAVYQQGDHFAFTLRAGELDLYLYVDYFQLDGHVVHLLPSPAHPDNRLGTGAALELGTAASGTLYEVLPPFGSERLVAIATTRPLYRASRREFEDGAAYLTFLGDRLAAFDPAAPLPQAVMRNIETYETLPVPVAVETAPPTAPTTAPAAVQETGVETATLPSALAPLPASLEEATGGRSLEEAPPRTIEVTPPPPSPSELFRRETLVPLIARMAEDPADEANVAALVEAYGRYALLLDAENRREKALRILDRAQALDFGNQEIAALRRRLVAEDGLEADLAEAAERLKSGEIDGAFALLARLDGLEAGDESAKVALSDLRARAAEAYSDIARTALTANDKAAAVAAWQKVLFLEPQNPTARSALLAIDLETE